MRQIKTSRDIEIDRERMKERMGVSTGNRKKEKGRERERLG